jgi:sugar lactone lactonase YvrE
MAARVRRRTLVGTELDTGVSQHELQALAEMALAENKSESEDELEEEAEARLDIGSLLSVLGLNGLWLGSVCKTWRTAANNKRELWTMLRAVRSFGEEGKGAHQFCGPHDVCAMPRDGLCISDTWNDRLHVIAADQIGRSKEVPAIIGKHGKAPGQFDHPRGVACDDENLYVVDSNNDRVQKFGVHAGEFLNCVGREGTGEERFTLPMGICLCERTRTLFVTDTHNHRVVALSTDLGWRYSFGEEGYADGELELDALGDGVHLKFRRGVRFRFPIA